MKARLVILSDLWGKGNSDWWNMYLQVLDNRFDIEFYDCTELAGVNTSNYTEDALHGQFVKGGISRAVSQLLTLEKEPIHLLGFSVGGVIGWQAAKRGMLIERFVAVSATRLRHETENIPAPVRLFFGEKDQFRPSPSWEAQMKIVPVLVPGKGHLCYTNPEVAQMVAAALD